MMTSTSLDPGLPPALAGGPPPMARAGAPDFADALNDRMAERVSIAQARDNRQDLADDGKVVPPRTPVRMASFRDKPDCELLDPGREPEPDAADKDGDDADDRADTGEPPLEPALAWLMPPVAPPAPAPAPAAADPKGLPLPGAVPTPLPGDGPAVGTAAAPIPPGPGRLPPAGSDSDVPATPVAAMGSQATALPPTAAEGIPTEPGYDLAPTPDERLRATAAAQRLELAPIAPPTPDSGATLAAAAVLRSAPTAGAGIADAATGSAGTPLDIGQFAPVAAGAPAALPVGSTPQAGIDLTQDQGLHRMIDRIEHLRDAFNARDTRIRLIPDALGPVDISVRRDAASDMVRVHFSAAEAGTRQLIAEAQQRLIELAETRGVRIERATVDSGGSGSGPAQGWGDAEQSGPHQQPGRPAQPLRAPARAARDADPQSTDERIA